MKKILMVLAVIALLVLDFLALDDITTGSEPDYAGEYLMLAVSIPLFFLLYRFWKKK